GVVGFADDRLTGEDLQAEVSAYARSLYADYQVADDFTPGKAPQETVKRKHHVSVAGFLANTGNSDVVREAAALAGRKLVGFGTDGKFHPEAVTPDFMGLALGIAVEDSGADFYNHLVEMLKTTKNAMLSRAILGSLGGATEPELVARTQDMILSGKLKQNEVPTLLFSYLSEEENRKEGWQWFKTNYQKIVDVMAKDQAASLPYAGTLFCSTEKAQEVETFFTGKVEELPGGPRNLAQALEVIRLCAAQKQAQSESAQAFFKEQNAAE
ncbi:MAG TPA: ERAP1-like C-terminal domain-containing protein, partial [Gammaproteobacteria bacterium]|nr:ERAP1-like C-terminal domain-containing protein [Gammaproteobacteria bacterium]